MAKIIRHPDLSRYTDKALKSEIKYLVEQCRTASRRIILQVHFFENMAEFALGKDEFSPGILPFWILHEDYRIQTDRLQAVVEEIEYRRIT